jgi:stage V sporulation protein SpoVS
MQKDYSSLFRELTIWRRNLFVALVVLMVSTDLSAQTTLGATTAEVHKSSVVHTYSIGEMCVVSTDVVSAATFTQGYLQPQSIDVMGADLCACMLVYPNPFNQALHVNCTTPETQKLAVSITNANGQLVHASNTNTKDLANEILDLSQLSAGVYFLGLSLEKSAEHCTIKVTKQ